MILNTSDISTTGFTVTGKTILSGNSANNILTVSGASGTILAITDNSSATLLNLANNNGANVFTILSGGSTAIGTNTFDSIAPETLNISGSSTTSYNLVSAHGNVNNYVQLNIQNISTGTSASSDIVATNDTGTETTNYIDMGINGSNYSASFIGAANDAYLYSTGRELWIGNASTGATSNIKFFAGDAATGTDMLISGLTGNVGIGSSLPTNRLTISASTDPVKINGLLAATTGDTGLLSIDASGVIHNLPITATTGSKNLLNNFTTSSTGAVSTNLSFSISGKESYDVVIDGTCSKATSATGLKFAISAPAGCTIAGVQYGGGATLAASLVPSLITSINTLGTTLATGTAIQVAFRLTFTVQNSSTAGLITLQVATVTSNVATVYAGTKMTWVKSVQV